MFDLEVDVLGWSQFRVVIIRDDGRSEHFWLGYKKEFRPVTTLSYLKEKYQSIPCCLQLDLYVSIFCFV